MLAEVSDETVRPDDEELERLGLFDPAASDAGDRLEMIRYAMGEGATVEDVGASTNLGELALDMQLRPRRAEIWGEVAEAAGLEWPTARRMLGALGLHAEPEETVRGGEAETLGLVAAVLESFGEEATMQLVRVAGNTMARLAETIVGGFRLRVERPQLDAGTRYADVAREYSAMAQNFLPPFIRTLDAVLRAQIMAVTGRMWSTDDERSAVMLARTVGFVDLVGYTETSGSLSVRELTEVLVDFDKRTAEVVTRGNGQVTKMIGDEAMFVTEDAADACRIALDLVEASGGEMAPVRVGLATGEMVSVFGDVYGPDVNLAARLVAVADPGTAVVSAPVRDAAHGFRFESVGPLVLKGFPDPVTAYRLAR
jgi:class 3 adenylate cyclase